MDNEEMVDNCTLSKDKPVLSGQAYLKGNVVILPPWRNEKGILVEWIPWDEI